ncbi:hypothetical protein JXA05_00975 [Candidatus Peregrinibacteria bacterium]|nr:hypothetical protein [Candidatus Peregrinibacteria bacterium]
MKRFLPFKLFILFAVPLFVLTACGGGNEAPAAVIQKFKQAATEIKSGDIAANITVKGIGAGSLEEETAPTHETMDLIGKLAAKFDRRDDEARTADVKIDLAGNMVAADQSFSGSIVLNLISVGEDFYANLSKLETSDESLTSVQPFIQKYMGQWLHVSNDFIPENIRNLQSKDEAAKAMEEQLKKLFLETNLFSVAKEFGVEKISGTSCYHYGVVFNPEGVKEYFRKAAVIDGRELTDAEVEDAAKIASYLTNAELWIGMKDYHLYKGLATLTSGPASGSSEVKFDIVFSGNAYNKDVKVEAPQDAQEFNPLELLMGTTALPTGESFPALTGDEAAALEGLEGMEGLDQATLDALMEAQEGAEE